TTVNTNAGGSDDAVKTWVDGNVQITPPTATNAVNTNHTLTIAIKSEERRIDKDTNTATASHVASSIGSFVGSPSCTITIPGTPSCTVVITSSTAGNRTVHATATFKVNGQTVTRATSTTVNHNAGGSDDAAKTWVDGNIQTTPQTATNAVNTNHTLTIAI